MFVFCYGHSPKFSVSPVIVPLSVNVIPIKSCTVALLNPQLVVGVKLTKTFTFVKSGVVENKLQVITSVLNTLNEPLPNPA